MRAYDIRGRVEKAFGVYKNDLDASRTRTGNAEMARRRLLIKFVALVVQVRIMDVLCDH